MPKLFDLISENCDNESNAIIYINADSVVETLSFSRLHSLSRLIEHKIRDSVEYLPKNSVIGIYSDVNQHISALMLAIMRTDCLFAYINPQNFRSKLSLNTKLYKQVLNAVICHNNNKKIFENFNEESVAECFDLVENYVLIKINSNSSVKLADDGDDSFAYLMTTSGTTGIPKLVFVPHSCIVPNIIDLRQEFDISRADTLLVCSQFTFDPSIVDLFIGVYSGAQVILIDNLIRISTEKLVNVINKFKVTYMTLTPSFWSRFSMNVIQNQLLPSNTSIRVLVFGGEKSPSIQLIRDYTKFNCDKTSIYNIYGVTEVSAWASLYKYSCGHNFDDECNTMPIYGRSLLSTNLIVDQNNEIFINSDVRRCFVVYFDNQEFDSDYKSDWSFNFKTNDCAKKSQHNNNNNNNNGFIYFLGRNDFTVKLNGKKLNLEFIEAIIARQFNCECVCTSSEWHHIDNSVVNIFIKINNNSFNDNNFKSTIVEFLRRKLDKKCAFIINLVNHFPLTSHLKIDRLLLSKQCSSSNNSNRLILNNSKVQIEEIYELVFKLLNTYLKLSDFSDINFIKDCDLKYFGGDSIIALQIAIDIEHEFHRHFALLVDKLLNSSLSDVCLYIKQTLIARQNGIESDHYLNQTQESISFKRKYQEINDNVCVSVISRRGYHLSKTCTESLGLLKNIDKHIKLSGDKVNKIEILWSIDMSQCVDSSPLLIRKHYHDSSRTEEVVVIIGSHSGQLLSVNVTDGSINWEIQLDDRIESSATCDRSGDHIFIGDYSGMFYCISALNGTITWQYMTRSQTPIKCSAICSSNLVFCGAHDRHVYAWNLAKTDDCDKQLVWKCGVSEASIFSSPVLSSNDDTIYVATLDGVLAAIATVNGLIMWKIALNCALFSSPVIFDDYCLIIGTTSLSSITAIDVRNKGSIIWTLDARKPVFSSPFLLNHQNNRALVFIGTHNNTLLCINASSGELLWQFETSSPVYSTPFVCEQTGVNCCLVFAESSGVLHVLGIDDGNEVCSYQLNGELFSSPIIYNKNIFIGCRDNNFYCLSLKIC